MPLGSPKYSPPVSSRTIKISKFSITPFLREDASASSLNRKAGRRFANKSSSFLKVKSACSGLLSHSKESHFGAPTAPKRIASESFANERASSVIGNPCSSYEVPPTDL